MAEQTTPPAGEQAVTAEAWELAAAFIEARVAEDEAVARDATQGGWRWQDPGGYFNVKSIKLALVAELPAGRWQPIAPIALADVYPNFMDAAHILRHDPVAALKRAAATRKVLARCVEVLKNSSQHATVESADEEAAVLAQEILYDLASSWEDHPDHAKWVFGS